MENQNRSCTVTGCTAKHYAKGLCVNHYYRFRNKGSVFTRRERGELNTQQSCAAPGCKRLRSSGDYCSTHYSKVHRSGTLKRVVFGEKWRERHSHPYRNSIAELDSTRDDRPGHAGYLAVNIVNEIKQKALTKSYGNSDRKERRAAGWWTLTGERAYRLIVGTCHYCGIKPNWPNDRNGIDRLDSNIGYTADNCVSACWRCNRAKGDDPLAEFTTWVDRVHAHLHR